MPWPSLHLLAHQGVHASLECNTHTEFRLSGLKPALSRMLHLLRSQLGTRAPSRSRRATARASLEVQLQGQRRKEAVGPCPSQSNSETDGLRRPRSTETDQSCQVACHHTCTLLRTTGDNVRPKINPQDPRSLGRSNRHGRQCQDPALPYCPAWATSGTYALKQSQSWNYDCFPNFSNRGRQQARPADFQGVPHVGRFLVGHFDTACPQSRESYPGRPGAPSV